jgi:hypothetical protein
MKVWRHDGKENAGPEGAVSQPSEMKTSLSLRWAGQLLLLSARLVMCYHQPLDLWLLRSLELKVGLSHVRPVKYS